MVDGNHCTRVRVGEGTSYTFKIRNPTLLQKGTMEVPVITVGARWLCFAVLDLIIYVDPRKSDQPTVILKKKDQRDGTEVEVIPFMGALDFLRQLAGIPCPRDFSKPAEPKIKRIDNLLTGEPAPR